MRMASLICSSLKPKWLRKESFSGGPINVRKTLSLLQAEMPQSVPHGVHDPFPGIAEGAVQIKENAVTILHVSLLAPVFLRCSVSGRLPKEAVLAYLL